MDGYEVASRMNQDYWRESAILIAITGYGQPNDRQRAFEAGFDHHFTKPVDIEHLRGLLGNSPAKPRSGTK
jgi:CheY-like chemotaxis protein